MSIGKKDIVLEFIMGLESLILGMQQVDASCLEAYKDVSKKEYTLLVMIGKSESMIMREVADFLQIPVSTATGIIDKLIEKGYVVREYSPEDRRIVIVRLSDEGKSIYLTLKEKLYCYGKALLQEFDDEERSLFIKLINKASGHSSGVRLEKV